MKLNIMSNFLKIKFRYETFMIVSIPFFMVISRFMLEVCLLLISISFLNKIWKEKKYFVFNNYFVIIFLCFYLVLLLSFFNSSEKQNILSILFYFRFGLYVIALYYFFKNDKLILKYFLYSALIIILLLFFDSLFQFFMGKNLVGFKPYEVHRITSFFNEEQVLGSYILRLFPLLLLLANMKNINSKTVNYLTHLAIFISPIIIVLSGERVALSLFFLMMSYYLIFFARSKIFRYFYLYGLILILSIGGFLYSSNLYFDRYITQTYKSIFQKDYSQNNLFLPEKYKDLDFYFLSAQHQNFIFTGMNIFKENKIFGTGPKSYRYVCGNEKYKINGLSCNTHPHNYYLQLLIETGLVGLIFVILIYFYVIYRSCFNFIRLLKNQYFDLSETIILGFYFVQLWPLMQHGSIFNNWNSIMLFLPMSVLLVLKKTPIKK